ncbi:uncharacterized protein AMSG_00128 [Thecamonas trahens ATCC 50062]|uniref:Spt4/RpoE2 zinc finger domain-containing protein n=1 Tax=Thecamonas trahens ATCC 50062 TaxID=461836 RepID=A0A0L0D1J5_THETB|nr:hypothetical protein AMSG_00128 [Thecamonas trahens ATCC 50062]KNC46010.1 hypothetical protein AMSG_00128 [Thecamonas trahens ATCC 50062]|eukprot:XP_013762990.1 hypothetical protein AMSG_00128 [Thecamonas trahens ATCC 50062]
MSVTVNTKMLPRGLKELRACRSCLLVKNRGQFENTGCENCGEEVGEAIAYLTTTSFSGLIAVMDNDTSKSWVSRYQRLGERKPGMYAIKITDTRPAEDTPASGAARDHFEPNEDDNNFIVDDEEDPEAVF